jgi:hypothetical protein
MKLHSNTILGPLYLLLLNSSGAPSLTLTGGTILETHSGVVSAEFTVSLNETHGAATFIDYTTIANGAEAGTDFTPVTGRLSIPANTLSTTLNVSVNGDTNSEPDEDFQLSTNRIEDFIGSATKATYWIRNDDNVLYGLATHPNNTCCLARVGSTRCPLQWSAAYRRQSMRIVTHQLRQLSSAGWPHKRHHRFALSNCS